MAIFKLDNNRNERELIDDIDHAAAQISELAHCLKSHVLPGIDGEASSATPLHILLGLVGDLADGIHGPTGTLCRRLNRSVGMAALEEGAALSKAAPKGFF